jgi:hypothetical protein
MITIKLQGGLGNQLFQIFTTIAHAFNTNEQFFFHYSETLPPYSETVIHGGTIRPTYWHTLLIKLLPYTIKNPPYGHNVLTHREPGFHYTPLPIGGVIHNQDKNKVIVLDGYFQSPKYFEKHKDTIIQMIDIDEHLTDFKLTMPKWASESSCSIHFRLGDYVGKQQYHTVLPLQYYVNAINQLLLRSTHVRKPEHFIVFSEPSDREIVDKHYLEHLKSQFPQLSFHHIEPKLCDWQQILVMANCTHNIIANSTFSWWGAYLTPNKDKTPENINKFVFYPAHHWFGPLMQNYDMRDLFPDDWVPIGF